MGVFEQAAGDIRGMGAQIKRGLRGIRREPDYWYRATEWGDVSTAPPPPDYHSGRLYFPCRIDDDSHANSLLRESDKATLVFDYTDRDGSLELVAKQGTTTLSIRLTPADLQELAELFAAQAKRLTKGK